MELIDLESVSVPENRIRTEFDESYIDELHQSILQNGNIHVPVLADGSTDLVAGECRLRAIRKIAEAGKPYFAGGQKIPPGKILVMRMHELPEKELRRVELEENLRRRDLSVQDRCRAIAEMHEFYVKEEGEFDASTKEGWTKTKTAEKMHRKKTNKRHVNEVSKALLIAEHLDDPVVAAAKNEKEALKAIRDQEKWTKRSELAKQFDPLKSKHTLLLGNSYEVARDPGFENKFDVLICDPPYGREMHKHTFWDGEKHEYDDSEEAFQLMLNELPDLSDFITKDQAHIYVFCDIRRWPDLVLAFEVSKWKVWPKPLIWDKGNTGSYGGIEFGFRMTYDAILYANKGEKPMTAGYTDQFHVTQPADTEHQASKPPELYEQLLRCSVYPGDQVADLYCGSGPIFVAAKKLDCIATGIELSEKYHQIAIETLEEIEK